MSHPQSYEILLVPGFVEDTAEAGEAGTGQAGTGEAGKAEKAGGKETAKTDAAASGGSAPSGGAVRSAVVSATGETGASGYPRYAGDGVVADVDPETRTVEALLVDGAELTYGLTARVRERDTGPGAGT
ncbi:hypothetical protein ACFVWY_10090 [Streptomyces sp. NPDC058195]|uniref:hypothetical protein n=1 Tax=Streptomyces sp. NPDC058195 TaxID=3346375 RepID=UPI0036ED48F7